MNNFLQIIGSIASIGGIPLAIYIFLRSREAKFIKLKREIVKVLSYQIGEGRNLSIFEIRSVIDSKIREEGCKQNSILMNEIIEYLVTETISSPMLDSERKQQILNNLQSLHQKSKIYNAIELYAIPYEILLNSIKDNVELLPEDENYIENIVPNQQLVKMTVMQKRTENVSRIFALFASIITILSFFIFILGKSTLTKNLSRFFEENSQIMEIIIGIVATLIAGILTTITAVLSGKKSKIKSEKKQQLQDE